MKKVFSIIGMVVGLAFVIVGIVAMSGGFGDETRGPSAPSYTYDYGYAQFGSDYYSYSNNNAAKAANNASAAAANTQIIAEFLEVFMGLSSMLFGFVIICAFGIVFASCIKKTEPCAVNVLSYPIYKEEVPAEASAE